MTVPNRPPTCAAVPVPRDEPTANPSFASELAAIVLSDVHLGAEPRPEREQSVVAVLCEHPGVDVVFLGDLFEFSTATTTDPKRAIDEILASNPTFATALQEHHATGAEIWLVAGNHDAALAELGPDLTQRLGAPVQVVPWCLRLGNVHLEHGHLFDADNAPLHPLAPFAVQHLGLGVLLMQTLVVGLGARELAHAHHLTPREALELGVRTYSWKMPWYLFRASLILCGLAVGAAFGRWGAARRAKADGSAQLPRYAERAGLSEPYLEHVLAGSAAPTHASFRRLMFRVYADWLVAVGLFLPSTILFVLTQSPLACMPAVCSGLYTTWCLSSRRRRYLGPVESLRAGAAHIERHPSVSYVVFGHSHVVEVTNGYVNTGSFGYGSPQGRPYAVISRSGSVEHRYHGSNRPPIEDCSSPK